MGKFLKTLLALLYLTCLCAPVLALQGGHASVKAGIRISEDGTGKITPAMVCITGVRDGLVRLPPAGAVLKEVSRTRAFYSGIHFKKDRNWIGPVRKMNGQGDNDDRSFVYDLLPSIPHWREPVMYQTSGDFSIALPPGEWRISIEHGNEFIPIAQTFTVPPQAKAITKTFRLKRWIDLPAQGWYSGDVHVHHPTDKPEFKSFLLKYAKAEDVHLVNVLEMGHHLGTEFKQEGFGEKFRRREGDIILVSGQEDPRSTYGHIIGLNIREQVREPAAYDYYDLVFRKLQLQPGAIVGYAHFSWNGCDLPRGFPWYITSGDIDFVELLQFSKINTLDYHDYLNLGFRITAAAGSDVPWGSTLGEVRTFVYTGKPFTADAWFQGLKAGHTFVSNGPALFLDADGKLPGSEIIAGKGAKTALRLKAVSHPGIGAIKRIAIYNNDGLVIEKLNPEKLDMLVLALDHVLEKSQWLAAIVDCDNGAVAHTTPLYFIVDGKPTWNLQKAPGIIAKQMQAMQAIETEEKAKKKADQGVLQRLEKARAFYRNILAQTDG